MSSAMCFFLKKKKENIQQCSCLEYGTKNILLWKKNRNIINRIFNKI